MQIITGKYRARKLKTIDESSTRPTLARVKESIFNLIQFKIDGAVVLDLFAGSGAFGVECISRNAKKVFFVENNNKAVKVIEENTNKMNEDFEIVESDFKDALVLFKNRSLKFDIVYLDPPYKSDFALQSLKLLSDSNLLNSGATVVVEHEFQNDLQSMPKCFIMEKSKKYGIALVDILTFSSED